MSKDYIPSLLCKKCSKSYLSCNCMLHPATIYNRKHIMKERVEAYCTDKQENWNIV